MRYVSENCFTAIGLAYACVAFVVAEANPFAWAEENRIVMVTLCGTFSVAVAMVRGLSSGPG